jgi:tRNA1(Val) A37 N6-methylase TrmN6
MQARAGREANLDLVRGRKGGRAAFRLHAPVMLHEGAVHMQDGEDYSAPVRAVLRDGAALAFPL